MKWAAPMSTRDIDALEPSVAAMARAFLAKAGAEGFDILVTCTRRTSQDQAELYAKGRTAPGPVVTWAKPGQSLHETGRAFDIVPLRAGKCCWGTKGADAELWRRLGELGESVGLEWAGRWPASKREFPHFQKKE